MIRAECNGMLYTARWYKPEKIEPYLCSMDDSYNFDVGTKHACMNEIHIEAEKKFKSIYGEGIEYNSEKMRISSCRTSIEIVNPTDNRLIVCAHFPGNGIALIIVPDEVYKWHKREYGCTYHYNSDKENGMIFSDDMVYEQIKELYKEMAQTDRPPVRE